MVVFDAGQAAALLRSVGETAEPQPPLDGGFADGQHSVFAMLLDAVEAPADSESEEGGPPFLLDVPTAWPLAASPSEIVPAWITLPAGATHVVVEPSLPGESGVDGDDTNEPEVAAIAAATLGLEVALAETPPREPVPQVEDDSSMPPMENTSAPVPTPGELQNAAVVAKPMESDGLVTSTDDTSNSRESAHATSVNVRANRHTVRDAEQAQRAAFEIVPNSPRANEMTPPSDASIETSDTTPRVNTTFAGARRTAPAAAERFAVALERVASTPVAPAASLDTNSEPGDDSGSSAFASGQAPARAMTTAVAALAPGATFVVPVATEVAAQPIAAAPSAASLPEASASPGPDVMSQLVQTMRLQFRDGIGEAVVRLKPEHLGEVSIALRVERQTVSATVNAEAASVRQWLQTEEPALREALAEHGLHLERLAVREDAQSSHERPRQHARSPRARRDANGSATMPQFEVVV
jgi:hypothetical protein